MTTRDRVIERLRALKADPRFIDGYLNGLVFANDELDAAIADVDAILTATADEARDGDAVAIIEDCLRKFDYYGLIKGGAPRDEFSGEARMIAARIGDNREQSNVALICMSVFIEMFGPHSSATLKRLLPGFDKLAVAIIAALHARVCGEN